MKVPALDLLPVALLVFCRVAACVMLLPGYASTRVPMRVRLWVATAVTGVLAPWVTDDIGSVEGLWDGGRLLPMVVSETVTGLYIGATVRVFYAALHFAAITIASMIGFSGVFAPAMEDAELSAPIADLVTLTATLMWFLTEQHIAALHALLSSYQWLKFNDLQDVMLDLGGFVVLLGRSFEVALRLVAPFLVYGILVNAVFGIVNRMIPQIPVYFISMPFVIAGGLSLLLFLFGQILEVFVAEFARAFGGG